MWMRVDDGLHAHRKTRAATKGDDKRRDAAPMGLWVLAGSWSGRNNQQGWVPSDELDRFDDDWENLAQRLVYAGFWWPEDRDGEPGFGFNDWGVWNNPTGPSASGTFGNHKRWHVDKGVVKDDCDLCPKEPSDLTEEPPNDLNHRPDSGATSPRSSPRLAPDVGSDIAPDSHPTSLRDHRPDSLTRPDPTRAIPDQEQTLLVDSSTDLDTGDRFEEFWRTYGHKKDRAGAEKKWRLALRKPGVTAELLISAARDYVTWERLYNENGRFIMGPTKWLLNERWNDERLPPPAPPQSRARGWLQLAADLGDAAPPTPQPRQIGTGR